LVDAFVDLGAAAFSADAAIHELYSDPEVQQAIRARWSNRVFAEDGAVNRSAIASIVFADEDERKWLEALLHPLVAREWLRFVHEHEARTDPPPMVVAEVPLLFEAGLEDRYDAVILVTAPEEIRVARAASRASGNTMVRERTASQHTDADKAQKARFVVENSGDLAALRHQAR